MIRRTTWIALAVFGVVLAAGIWWTQREIPPSGEPTVTAPAAVWSILPEQVRAVEVLDSQKEVLVRAVRAEDVGWLLEFPVGVQANAGRIEQAVTSLLNLSPRTVYEGVDLADFGLDAPGLAIRLELETGSVQELLLGRTAPTGGAIYARLPDSDQVLVFSEFLFSDITTWGDAPPIATPTVVPTELATPEA